MKTHPVRDFDILDENVIDPDAHLHAVDTGHIDAYPFGYRQARLTQDARDVVRLGRKHAPFRKGQTVTAERDAIHLRYMLTAIRGPLHRGKPARVRRWLYRVQMVQCTVVMRGVDVSVRYGDFDDAKSPELLHDFR